MLMRTRRFLAAILLGCALALWVLPGSLDLAMAQQQPPLDPSPALAEPTPSPLPTMTPTPAPTLTLPQFSIEQWVALLLPVVGALMVAIIKPWRERFLRWFDRLTGGEKHDLEEELRREQVKERLEAEQKATEARRQRHTARDVYLSHLEQEMLRLAKIPALGREQRELGLEQVYVPLYVVERDTYRSTWSNVSR